MQHDKTLIAILVSRENHRLDRQVKSLEKLLHQPFADEEYQKLTALAQKWRDLLANPDCEELLQAMASFVAAYKAQDPKLNVAYSELVFHAELYRKGHWSFVEHFVGSLNGGTGKSGVLPERKKEFTRRYEPKKKLSVEEQSRLLKKQYELVSNRDDPWRTKEMMDHGLMDENGIIPMGKQQALAVVQEKEKSKPKAGRVLDFFAGKLKKK